jgi:hypothetical protein
MQKPGLFGMNGFTLFLLTCFSFSLRAQPLGSLILIDAENKQAFTVRIGDQFYASSGHGHLLLSHLKDSVYRLNLRFPKNNLAEQVFPVLVRQKDLGFQLKGADSSWVLYNWQTKETIRPVNERDSNRVLEIGIKREDGFSKMMAAVVDDSTVMYNTYSGNGFGRDSLKANPPSLNSGGQSRQPPATNPPSLSPGGQNGQRPTVIGQPPKISADSLSAAKKTTASKDSLLAAKKTTASKDSLLAITKKIKASNDSLIMGNGQRPTANGQRPIVTPSIKKLREVNLKISRKMIFMDRGRDGLIDTITLFVFFETGDTVLKKQSGAELMAVKKTPVPDSAVVGRLQVKNKTELKPNASACRDLASDGDVQFLRSAILTANSDQEKIAVSSAAFARKCFSVSQVRLLAALFVSDKSRYRLMEAAQAHIADRDHFRELVDMYTDKNFQKKFLVMADKRS